MKAITNAQRHNFWSKWITALFLLPGVKINCFSHKPLDEILQNTTPAELRNKIARIDISKPVKGDDWLHATVEEGAPDKVKVILEKINRDKTSGVKYKNNFPNMVDQNGKTVVRKAIEKCDQKNYEQIAALLIDDPNIDLHEVNSLEHNKHRPTLLVVALKNKNSIIAQKLINEGGERLDITKPDPESGATPLHLAIKNKFKDVTESLLTLLVSSIRYLSINHLYVEDNQGSTPLHLAIESGAESTAKTLVDKVEQSTTPLDNLCAEDINGHTPLHLAAFNNAEEIFSYILIKIRKLYKLYNNHDEWIRRLFMQYKGRYIPTNMFRHIINRIGQALTKNEWDNILKEIQFLKNSKEIELIDHANALSSIVVSNFYYKKTHTAPAG